MLTSPSTLRFAVYPLLKRITHWPQAWLGFAMNFGFITSWVSVTGGIDGPLLTAAMTGCWWYVHKMHDGLVNADVYVHSWTMLYGTMDAVFPPLVSHPSLDTIYACQDIKDDVKVGVRSTAILFGSWIRPLLMTCAIIFVMMLAIAGCLNGQGHPYFLLSVGGSAAHLVWQFMTVDLEVPSSCWRESLFAILLNRRW